MPRTWAAWPTPCDRPEGAREMADRTAVFTGTFDPLTLGHLDVIRRGSSLFDHLVVGIGVNPNKASLFSVEERVELARKVVAPIASVSVASFDGLAVQF